LGTPGKHDPFWQKFWQAALPTPLLEPHGRPFDCEEGRSKTQAGNPVLPILQTP
jgi:hypothetical protein